MGNQLSLFDILLPPDKRDFTKISRFLTNIPIFYWGHQVHNKDTILKRKFINERDVWIDANTKKTIKEEMNITIKGTTVENGKFEFLNLVCCNVLDALIFLACRDDTVRTIDENGNCVIELTHNKIYQTLNKKVLSTDIRKSIEKLHDTAIYISDKNGNNVISMENIISKYGIKEKNNVNNSIYYIGFNKAFSEQIATNRVKLLAWNNLIDLKNPLSKYIVKKIVLMDIWTTKNYQKAYKSKSLFTFLLNSGYDLTTEMNKNNSMACFRKARRELIEKGLVEVLDIVPIREGNKIIDYTFTIIPSQKLVDNNFNQLGKEAIRRKRKKNEKEYFLPFAKT